MSTILVYSIEKMNYGRANSHFSDPFIIRSYFLAEATLKTVCKHENNLSVIRFRSEFTSNSIQEAARLAIQALITFDCQIDYEIDLPKCNCSSPGYGEVVFDFSDLEPHWKELFESLFNQVKWENKIIKKLLKR